MSSKSDFKETKQKRIPCPYCKELIMPGAIKCRFCGEKLTSNNQYDKKKQIFFSTKILYFIWLLCLILFLSNSVFIKNYSESSSNLLLSTILVGTVVFIFLFFRVVQPKHFDSGKYRLITLFTFIAFFAILINQKKVRALLGLPSTIEINQPTNVNQSNKIVSPTPIPTKSIDQVNKKVNTVPKTNTNLIDCTGPDGVIFKTTQQECDNFNTSWNNPPTPDPNEIIRCNIHINCGGGYKEITRKSCDEATCCSLDGGNIFTSKSDCENKLFDQCIDNATKYGIPLDDALDMCK